MSLKRVLTLISIFFLTAQAIVLAISLSLVNHFEDQSLIEASKSKISHLYNFHKTEIIGNIIAGNHQILRHFLEELSKSENLHVKLESNSGFNFNNLPNTTFLGAQSDFHLNYAGRDYGSITIYAPIRKGLAAETSTYFLLIVGQLAVAAFFVAVFLKWSRSSIIHPFASLLEFAKTGDRSKFLKMDNFFAPNEVKETSNQIARILDENKRKSEAEARSEIYAQIAHDIQSPLTSLEMIARRVGELVEDQSLRTLTKNAIQDIRDMTQNFLSKCADEKHDELKSEAHFLSHLMDSVIAEKRFQIKEKNLRHSLVFNHSHQTYGVLSKISCLEFRRILSNIINNSIEALNGTPGEIHVELTTEGSEAKITICDNGPGIPNEVLSKVFERGFSSGKTDGSGLGLAHAEQIVSEAGGSIGIVENSSSGVKIELRLPLAQDICWVLPSLNLWPGCKLLIVDDDKSVHCTWASRLDRIDTSKGIQVTYVNQECDFLREYKEVDLVLMDYELKGWSCSGLNLIERFFPIKNSILVTSRASERKIRDRCSTLGLKLVPKTDISYIPISVSDSHIKSHEKNEEIDTILIDDSDLEREKWKIIAQEKGKKILTFDSFEKLIPNLSAFKKNTEIYVDCNLNGDQYAGSKIIRHLNDRGFHNLYLSTGYPADSDGNYPDYANQCLPFIKGVVVKEPLWA